MGEGMKNRLYALLCSVFLVGVTIPLVQAEEMYDLLGRSLTVAYEGYAEVEECEYDKPIAVGGYIFVCSGFGYPYHYGSVKVLSEVVAFKGRKFVVAYLCMEGKEECLSGFLYSR